MSNDKFIITRGILRLELELFFANNPSTSREYELKLGRVDINIKDVLRVEAGSKNINMEACHDHVSQKVLVFHMKNKQYDIVAFNPCNIEELPIELQKKVKPMNYKRKGA
jgi:hypothetical protein